MAAINPYDELGVPRNAPGSEIKRAFRAKAQRKHPDRGGSPEEFAALHRAYRVLASPERRARFDQTGDADDSGSLVSNLEANAVGLILGVFGSILADETYDLSRRDPIVQTVQLLRQGLQQIAADADFARKGRRRIEEALQRLDRKGPWGADPIRHFLEERRVICDRRLGETKDAKFVHEAAIAMLKAYSWTTDKAPSPLQRAMTSGQTTTNTKSVFGFSW
jgi:curved DNA-binding protein CbpA